MAFREFMHIVFIRYHMTLSFTISPLFSSPFLPLQSPTVISLYVRFWDFSQLRLRTLQLQCHNGDGDEGTQPTVPPFIYTPAQPPPQFQVVCSSQHMSVKLLPVPTSGLIVQGEIVVCFIDSHDNGASKV